MSSGYINLPVTGSSATTWKDPVAAVINLPASGNTVGDVRLVTSTGAVYYWNGAAWTAIAGGGGGGYITSVANTTTMQLAVAAGVLTADVNLSSNGPSAGNIYVDTIQDVSGPFPGLRSQLAKTDLYPAFSGTAPVTFNGTTGAIGMPVATNAVDGYLSSADRTSFAAKQPAGSYITDLTGDVVATGPGSAAATIQALAVTTGKIANAAVDLTTKVTGALPLANLANGTANQLIGATAAGTGNEFKTITTGTAGTNFAIVHTANTITVNLPDASGTARGAVTTGAQTIGGSKTLGSSNTDKLTVGTAVSTAVHQINGGMFWTVRAATTSFTIDTTTSDMIVLMTATAATTITLPTPTLGRILIIKNVANTSDFPITLTPSTGVVDGQATYILNQPRGAVTIVGNGTNWYCI